MSAPSFRPILPALTTDERGPPVGSTGDHPKRKRGSQACEACRVRKTKCTAERPTCMACLGRKSACRYVATEARQARRKYEELRRHKSTHEELLSLMKTLPEQNAIDIFQRIRAGGDVGAILSHVRDGDLLLQMHLVPETRLRYELPYSRDMPELLLTSRSPYLESMIYKAASQRAIDSTVPIASERTQHASPAETSPVDKDTYVKPYHAAVFVEPRLENAKPSAWTTISKDDILMRDLLATYFTHEYHLFPVFHKDYFLEDMADARRANQSKECCSALLVNATLAYACYCSMKLSNRFRYWEPEALGYRFLAEAKRIWEIEMFDSGHRSLTSVQAAIIINVIYNFCALDKVGRVYGLRGLAIAQDLQLFDGNGHINSQRLRNARNFTAWALFNMDSLVSWHYSQRPILHKPPEFRLPDPSSKAAWYGEIHIRYPLSQSLSSTQYGHVFKALSGFRVILTELRHAYFDNGLKLLAPQAMAFVGRFVEWFKNLPLVLTPKHIVLPAHFLIHLDYYIVLITICQPFIQEQWKDDLVPKELVADSERDLNILMRLYYLRHGFSHADAYLLSPLAKLGFTALQSINSQRPGPELHTNRSTLFLALQGLREQGRSYYISRTMYYILRKQVRPEEAQILHGTEDMKTAADESPDLDGEIQSAWTPNIADVSDNSVATELSQLATQYLELDATEERSDDATPGSSPSPIPAATIYIPGTKP